MAPNAQHYAWAGGHALMVIAATRYLLTWIFFKSAAYGLWYKCKPRQYIGHLQACH